MSVSQEQLDGVTLLIKDSTTNAYAQLSSLTIVLFDYLVTFDDEIKLVWSRNAWGIGSILFFVNRYSGIFSLAFNSAIYLNNTLSDDLSVISICFHWVRYQIGGTIGAFWLVDIILALRVWALWGRSRRVLIFMSVMFISSLSFVAIVAGIIFRNVTVMPRPGSFAYGCFPLGFPVYTFLLAIPEVLNSGVLLGMTLFRTIRTVRMGRRNAPLFMLFIKDGCLYYVCILIILLMNAFAFSSFEITAAASGLAIAIPCVFGSRILLNLRRQLLKQQSDPSIPTMATMEFGGAERSTHTVIGPITTSPDHIEMRSTSSGTTQLTSAGTVHGEVDRKKDEIRPVHSIVVEESQ